MAKRRKKKRSPAQGKQATPKQPFSPPGGPASDHLPPVPLAFRAAFLLGVGATVALLVAGVLNSIRTEGRLPGVAPAYSTYMDVLLDAEDQDQVLDQLQLALALDIVSEPQIMNNLANVLQTRGRSSEAIAYYREAIRIKPSYVMPYYNLGKALAEQGDREQAIELYRVAVERQPGHVDARYNLANSLALLGAIEESIQHYEQVLQLQPDHAPARINLGWMLVGEGRFDEALVRFQEAVRLEPDLGPALMGLSWVLATHPVEARRDPERALELARRALTRLPRLDRRSLDIAAAAHAAVGDYGRAVELAQAAVDMAPPGHPELPAMRERLELYRKGQPYREST